MQPDLILIPFGKNATPGTIDPIPKTRGPDDDPQQATWDEGFPQVTMTPLAAGGIPPKGQDFNGVLKAISEHTVFSEHGGQFKFSSDYVTASGGYSIGDVIQADDGFNSYVSLVDNNTENFNTSPGSIGTSWGLYAGRASQAQATEATAGVAKIATQLQVSAGADDSSIVTPAKLRGAQADQAEAESGTDNTKLMTPLRVFQAISAKIIQATESVLGLLKVATQSQTDAGSNDATSVTPKKLRNGFAIGLGANGYITVPSWLGGLIIQWGSATTTGGVVVPNYPIAFPAACYWAGMCISSASFLGQFTPSVGNITLTTIQLLVSTGPSVGGGSLGVRWLAIGK